MVKDALAGNCPFCKLDPAFNVVIAETTTWNAWQSRAPEKGTAHHFIIAPKRHVKAVKELNYGEWVSLVEILNKLDEQHGITSSGIQIRDGDARLSAGTVEHLHVHKMVPNGTVRVESPFFKGAESEAEGHARAIVFEKFRLAKEKGGFDEALENLSVEELQLINGRMG
jgi:diadenosine tetraphosphate (Ap4A) HIT family hydrolase